MPSSVRPGAVSAKQKRNLNFPCVKFTQHPITNQSSAMALVSCKRVGMILLLRVFPKKWLKPAASLSESASSYRTSSNALLAESASCCRNSTDNPRTRLISRVFRFGQPATMSLRSFSLFFHKRASNTQRSKEGARMTNESAEKIRLRLNWKSLSPASMQMIGTWQNHSK